MKKILTTVLLRDFMGIINGDVGIIIENGPNILESSSEGEEAFTT
jgi:hypothetical protein